MRQAEFVKKKGFAWEALDLEDRIFVVYLASLVISNTNKFYRFMKSPMIFLQVDKASTTVLSKNWDFIDIVSLELIAVLLGYTEINNHAINLVNSNQ